MEKLLLAILLIVMNACFALSGISQQNLELISRIRENDPGIIAVSGFQKEKASEVIAPLMEALKNNSHVKQLNLCIQDIHTEDAKVMSAALGTGKITIDELVLNVNRIGSRDARAITEALSKTRIKKLVFGTNVIDSSGAKAIASVLPRRLTELSLEGNNIGDEGTEAIARVLTKKKQLEKLNLSDSSMRDTGAKALITALPQTRLTKLGLAGNAMDASLIEEIAKVLSRTSLEELELSNNYAGVKGAEAIAAELPKTKLTTLNLAGNCIYDEGVKALMEKQLQKSPCSCLKRQ